MNFTEVKCLATALANEELIELHIIIIRVFVQLQHTVA
jgi:hypothetical protein